MIPLNNTDDKLDAHHYKSKVLLAQRKVQEAYAQGISVLSALGQNIPDDEHSHTSPPMVKETIEKLKKFTDEELIDMKEVDSKFHYSLMRMYIQVTHVAYFARPKMQPYLTLKSLQLGLEHGFCKYSAASLVLLAALLPQLTGNLDVTTSSRMSKIALALLERFKATDLLPYVFCVYYSFVAIYTEPLMDCANNLRKGFQVGMTIGDTSMAFICGLHYIQKVS